jgi:hypothetical protein
LSIGQGAGRLVTHIFCEARGMSTQWYYQSGSEQRGPVPATDLMRLVRDGHLGPHDRVWRDGMKEWVPVETVKGLRELISEPVVVNVPRLATAAPRATPAAPRPVVVHTPHPTTAQPRPSAPAIPVARAVAVRTAPPTAPAPVAPVASTAPDIASLATVATQSRARHADKGRRSRNIPIDYAGVNVHSRAIAGFVLCFLPLPLNLAGLFYCLTALSRMRGRPLARGRGLAIAGIIIVCVWIVSAIVSVLLYLHRLGKL